MSHVSAPAIAKILRLVPSEFGEAIAGAFPLATIKRPEVNDRTLIARELQFAEVRRRVCPRCYALNLKNDDRSAEVRYFYFRATKKPRIYSPNQPGVQEVSMKEEPLYYFDEIKPASVRALVRRYRWGILGVLISEEGHVEVRYEREKATFKAKYVEFVRV